MLLIAVLLSSGPVQPADQRADDKAAIVQTLLDYAEGYYGGEPARMTRAVSPYLTKRERDGAWQILNVLWHAPPAAASPDETTAVSQAVRTLAAALTGAGGPDALSVLHPLAHLRVLTRGRQGRPRFVVEQNAEALVAGLARGAGKLPGAIEDAQIAVEGIDTDVAAARIVLGPTRTYLHLALQEGRWRVVNMLNWTAAPAAGASR